MLFKNHAESILCNLHQKHSDQNKRSPAKLSDIKESN